MLWELAPRNAANDLLGLSEIELDPEYQSPVARRSGLLIAGDCPRNAKPCAANEAQQRRRLRLARWRAPSPRATHDRPGRSVGGVDDLVDLVILAT
jgi:hypothetical protein